MKNITKKLTIILGAIIFSFALVNSVSAYSHYAYSTDPVGYELDSNSPIYYYQQPVNINPIYPPYYQQPVVITPTVTTTTATKPTTSVVNNYYYQTAPATTKTTTTNTSNNTTSGTPTYIPATSSTTNGLGASAYNGYNQATIGNGITALSLKGSGGFMPSSIWQWIIVVVLILIIIIIARMFVHKPDPADHDVLIHNNAAPAH
jgi:hypothetical protein